MSVNVLYFAALRERFGRAQESVALPSSVRTVSELGALLRERGGAWAAELAPGRALRAAVNQSMADATTPIKDGDEVAFFPPVTGG